MSRSVHAAYLRFERTAIAVILVCVVAGLGMLIGAITGWIE